MAFLLESIPVEHRSEVKGYVNELYGSQPPRNSFFSWAVDKERDAKMFFSDDIDGDGYCLVWGKKVIGVNAVIGTAKKGPFATINRQKYLTTSEEKEVEDLIQDGLFALDPRFRRQITFSNKLIKTRSNSGKELFFTIIVSVLILLPIYICNLISSKARNLFFKK